LDTELHREVALKQILDQHADDQVSRARFLIEAEITGGLEHPGIVPVYGLGTYGDGRPYYAMRFIKGNSLKEAIERFHTDEALKNDPGRRSLVLRQLLRRFTDVCNAIAYAHSRGVLHRDLKPGNVIVGQHGETLVVDWGLAKATGQSDPSSGERTLLPVSASGLAETLPGSALGTPAYMSPEQAEGNLEALGPRSDVYSLGATLYCLLTGRPPLAGDAVDVIPRVQRGDFRPPRRIDAAIDAALEAIRLKAMALRPEDRYDSCRALAEDLERWMADEPVSAWREPLSRRARRWGRRHRTAVSTAGMAVLAGLIGLTAVAAVQNRSNRELKTANAKTSRALAAETKAKNDATEALGQSEDARKRAEAVLGFLKDDVLATARPEGQEGGLGVEVTVRRAVEAAEPKIAGAFRDQPLVEADVRDTLGTTYHHLREAPLAIRQHERAVELRRTNLGPDHPHTLTSRNNLAVAYQAAGRTADAITLHEGTLRLRESTLGLDHPDTLQSRNNLAAAYKAAGRTAEALTLFEATLKQRESKLGPDHPDTLTSRHNLATAYRSAGRTAEAVTLFEATLKQKESKLGPDHPSTLVGRTNLASAYQDAGRTEEAITLHQATLKQQESKLGPDHPDSLISRTNLAGAYYAAGRTADATTLLEATLKLSESKLGPDHPNSLISRNNLASAYVNAGRTDQAIKLLEATLKQQELKLGPDHPHTLLSRNNLAVAYRAAGHTADAITLHEATLKQRESKLGPDHPDTHLSRANLALSYQAAGRLTDALPLFEGTLKRLKAKLGPDHPSTLLIMNNLAGAYLDARRWAEAEPTARECLSLREKKPPDDWWCYHTKSQLGAALAGQTRYAEAEPLILAGYEGMKARAATIPAPSKSRLTEAAERVVRLYENWGKPEQATAWKAKLGMRDLPAEVFDSP
jgi:tetratricopeptide (TPR) repeat protein